MSVTLIIHWQHKNAYTYLILLLEDFEFAPFLCESVPRESVTFPILLDTLMKYSTFELFSWNILSRPLFFLYLLWYSSTRTLTSESSFSVAINITHEIEGNTQSWKKCRKFIFDILFMYKLISGKILHCFKDFFFQKQLIN